MDVKIKTLFYLNKLCLTESRKVLFSNGFMFEVLI